MGAPYIFGKVKDKKVVHVVWHLQKCLMN